MNSKERQLFYLYSFGDTSFKRVIDSCDHLISKNLNTNDPLFYPLLTAIIILYSKPFSNIRGINREARGDFLKIIPDNKKELHNEIIVLRNKTFAHSDTSGSLKEFSDFKLNKVGLMKTATGYRAFVHEFRSLKIADYKTLAEILFEKCIYHRKKMGNKRLKNMDLTANFYTLNLDMKHDAFIEDKESDRYFQSLHNK